MRIDVKPGRYVIAVSGGVDSMVLLNMLSNLTGVELVIAHFNHGIRPDSKDDEKFVAAAAREHGLAYESGRGQLGAGASEERARDARYEFLESARVKHGAGAIITAHHQDDLIETALINLLRGTGRRGLTALADNPKILRPLLGYSKQEILDYAQKHKLRWRQDPTNEQTDYLRNYIRHNIVAGMNVKIRQSILDNISSAGRLNAAIESELPKLAGSLAPEGKIDRSKFSALPVGLGNELLMYWLRRQGVRDFDKQNINRLNVAVRTAKSGTTHQIKKGLTARFTSKIAYFAESPSR